MAQSLLTRREELLNKAIMFSQSIRHHTGGREVAWAFIQQDTPETKASCTVYDMVLRCK